MKKLIHEETRAAGNCGAFAIRELVRHVLVHEALTQRQLAARMGIGPTTLNNWLAGAPQCQLDAFLRLLEMVSENERWQQLSNPRICRTMPSLRHARLNHDLTQISRLHSLLQMPRGLTVVQGGSGEARTFLCHALASAKVGSLGLDAHQPDWFVPAAQMHCLDNPVDPAVVRTAAERWLKNVAHQKDRFLSFNGVLGLVPDLRPRLLSLAHGNHVVLVDDLKLTRSEAAAFPLRPVQLLALTGTNETIRVQFAGWSNPVR